MIRIAVVGGGLSGTTAAWQLAREQAAGSPIDFTLYEASHRFGGIVETHRENGFVLECGADSWVSEKPWARELAAELCSEMDESEIIASKDEQRRTYIFRDGQLIPMPSQMRMMVPEGTGSALDAVRHSPLFTSAAIAAYESEPGRAEELKRSALKDGEDESVAAFVRRHFGEEVTRSLAGPLLAGVFGGSVETLSVRAVMPAFVRMEREHGSLILAMEKRRPSADRAISVFTSLRSGLQTFIDRMVPDIPPASIRLGSEVISIARAGDTWTIRTASGSESYDRLILATPAHVTRRLLAPLDPAFGTLLDMEATSAIVVALAFSPENASAFHIPPGFGFLVPPDPAQNRSSEPSLLACTFVDQKFPHRAAPGARILRAFYGGDAAPALLSHSDDHLAALAQHQLATILQPSGSPLPRPAVAIVRRWPRSLPQYAVGHLDRMKRLASITESFSGLALIGNAYHGVGLPDMIREGREAARRFAAERI
ncbi:protoporphyrinogen oxidase [Paracidobacterium acidisoli]|uniref:Coproporphyrinogen III oxidase n=1 Tax=Paracidobacterium acidisoli TaxID=2303751 RepID=A0A372INT4_9BACT|nr:protoporphyrinogen oxidase [Paracidobacterium acidisoli]MBT9331951.1 protoporphyrinogen oxidase [Paracidobacterium acidisoli]